MHPTTLHFKHSMTCRVICASLVFFFSFGTIIPPYVAEAQVIPMLPIPGTMVMQTPGFVPVLMKGITIHPENPLAFDFIIDTGDSGIEVGSQAFKDESMKLVKYFLASLTVPENEMWVNLSPYEEDRVIPEAFGMTEMGMDLLAQDYILKQLTASLVYPEEDLGKKFWDRVYARAQREFGTTDIPMDSFHKVWILPQEALVYEKGNQAFVIRNKLKVMMEEDYFALKEAQSSEPRAQSKTNELTELQTEVMREIILPEIEKEVNEGENFAQLRQIFQSAILATWFKQNLKESLLGQVYVDQKKMKGIDIDNPQVKEDIYQQYVKAFEKGVYNYIKEDYDPQTQQIIPRQYFSGGVTRVDAATVQTTVKDGDKTMLGLRKEVGAVMRGRGNKGEVDVNLLEKHGDPLAQGRRGSIDVDAQPSDAEISRRGSQSAGDSAMLGSQKITLTQGNQILIPMSEVQDGIVNLTYPSVINHPFYNEDQTKGDPVQIDTKNKKMMLKDGSSLNLVKGKTYSFYHTYYPSFDMGGSIAKSKAVSFSWDGDALRIFYDGGVYKEGARLGVRYNGSDRKSWKSIEAKSMPRLIRSGDEVRIALSGIRGQKIVLEYPPFSKNPLLSLHSRLDEIGEDFLETSDFISNRRSRVSFSPGKKFDFIYGESYGWDMGSGGSNKEFLTVYRDNDFLYISFQGAAFENQPLKLHYQKADPAMLTLGSETLKQAQEVLSELKGKRIHNIDVVMNAFQNRERGFGSEFKFISAEKGWNQEKLSNPLIIAAVPSEIQMDLSQEEKDALIRNQNNMIYTITLQNRSRENAVSFLIAIPRGTALDIAQEHLADAVHEYNDNKSRLEIIADGMGGYSIQEQGFGGRKERDRERARANMDDWRKIIHQRAAVVARLGGRLSDGVKKIMEEEDADQILAPSPKASAVRYTIYQGQISDIDVSTKDSENTEQVSKYILNAVKEQIEAYPNILMGQLALLMASLKGYDVTDAEIHSPDSAMLASAFSTVFKLDREEDGTVIGDVGFTIGQRTHIFPWGDLAVANALGHHFENIMLSTAENPLGTGGQEIFEGKTARRNVLFMDLEGNSKVHILFGEVVQLDGGRKTLSFSLHRYSDERIYGEAFGEGVLETPLADSAMLAEDAAREVAVQTGLNYWEMRQAGQPIGATRINQPIRASKQEDVPDVFKLDETEALELEQIGARSLLDGKGAFLVLEAGASSRMNPADAPANVREMVGGKDIKSKAGVPIGRLDGEIVTFHDFFFRNVAGLLRTLEHEANEAGIEHHVWDNAYGGMTNADYREEHVDFFQRHRHYGLDPNNLHFFNQPLGYMLQGTPEDVELLRAKLGERRYAIAMEIAKGVEEKIKTDPAAVILEGDRQTMGHAEFLFQLIVSNTLLWMIEHEKEWFAVRNVDNVGGKYDRLWLRALGLMLRDKVDFQPEVSPRSPGMNGGALVIDEVNGNHLFVEDPTLRATTDASGNPLVRPQDSFWFNNATATGTVSFLLDLIQAEGQTRDDVIAELKSARNDLLKREEIAERAREKFVVIIDPKPAKVGQGVSVKRELNLWNAALAVSPQIKVRAVGVRGARNFPINQYNGMSTQEKTQALSELRFLSAKFWDLSDEEIAKIRTEMESDGHKVTDAEVFIGLEAYEHDRVLYQDLIDYVENPANLVTPGLLKDSAMLAVDYSVLDEQDAEVLRGAEKTIADILKAGFDKGAFTKEVYERSLANTFQNLAIWTTDQDIYRLSPGVREANLKAMREGRWDDIIEAYRAEVPFGTAGIRGFATLTQEELLLLKEYGLIAAILKGPNTINDITLLKKTQAVINMMKVNGQTKVAIGYDSRIAGQQFAELLARQFIGASTPEHMFTIYLFDEASPFPELSFGVREMEADWGIFISASHNPRRYNGYKITRSNGAQLNQKAKEAVLAADKQVKLSDIKVAGSLTDAKEGQLVWLGGDQPLSEKEYHGFSLVDMHSKHIAQVKKFLLDNLLIQRQGKNVKIGFAAYNGSGYKAVPRLLTETGFANFKAVTKLQKMDGMFPAFNPEEQPDPGDPIAGDVAVREFIDEYGQEAFDELDAVIGTDPDADRMGLTLKVPEDQQKYLGKYRLLPANDTWTLLIWYRLMKKQQMGLLDPEKSRVLFSHVTTDALEATAELFGVKSAGDMFDKTGTEARGGYLNDRRTWVGFTYIGDWFEKLIEEGYYPEAGAEESNGFSIGGHVLDKDGTFAAILMAEVLAYAKDQGTTAVELLDNIYRQIGFYATANKPLPRVGSFKGAAGVSEKIKMVQKAEEWMKQANQRAGTDNPLMLAGREVIGAVSFGSNRVDALHYKDIPDEGIRFFFKDEVNAPAGTDFTQSRNYVTLRISGTSQTIRAYTQLWTSFNVEGEEAGKLKAQMYADAEAVSLMAQAQLIKAVNLQEKHLAPVVAQLEALNKLMIGLGLNVTMTSLEKAGDVNLIPDQAMLSSEQRSILQLIRPLTPNTEVPGDEEALWRFELSSERTIRFYAIRSEENPSEVECIFNDGEKEIFHTTVFYPDGYLNHNELLDLIFSADPAFRQDQDNAMLTTQAQPIMAINDMAANAHILASQAQAAVDAMEKIAEEIETPQRLRFWRDFAAKNDFAKALEKWRQVTKVYPDHVRPAMMTPDMLMTTDAAEWAGLLQGQLFPAAVPETADSVSLEGETASLAGDRAMLTSSAEIDREYADCLTDDRYQEHWVNYARELAQKKKDGQVADGVFISPSTLQKIIINTKLRFGGVSDFDGIQRQKKSLAVLAILAENGMIDSDLKVLDDQILARLNYLTRHQIQYETSTRSGDYRDYDFSPEATWLLSLFSSTGRIRAEYSAADPAMLSRAQINAVPSTPQGIEQLVHSVEGLFRAVDGWTERPDAFWIVVDGGHFLHAISSRLKKADSFPKNKNKAVAYLSFLNKTHQRINSLKKRLNDLYSPGWHQETMRQLQYRAEECGDILSTIVQLRKKIRERYGDLSRTSKADVMSQEEKKGKDRAMLTALDVSILLNTAKTKKNGFQEFLDKYKDDLEFISGDGIDRIIQTDIKGPIFDHLGTMMTKNIAIIKMSMMKNPVLYVDVNGNFAILVDQNVGGIDLNPEFLDLKIKRDGAGIPLPMPQQSIEQMMQIEGFLPVIINVTPIQNLPMLLGMDVVPDGEDEGGNRLGQLDAFDKVAKLN